MVFLDPVFLFFFLPAVILLTKLSPRPMRNAVLLFFSLLFYAWGEPVYILLMLAVIAINYLAGLRLLRFPADSASGRQKLVLTLAILLDLLILGIFKYTGFFAELINNAAGLALPVPQIVLPIGISFYIFQSMSYVIDVYRGDADAQRSILGFGTYVALFPQLIAGPIVRYRDIALQLTQREETVRLFADGAVEFVYGLAKKVLLANQMGLLADRMLLGEGGTISAWVGMAAYTLQIYFDFSGYSDMAIGLGQMFGFRFLKTLTILISPEASQSSGDAGTCPCPPGSRNMSISRWAATGRGFYGSAYSGSGLWLTQPDTLELWHSAATVQVSDESGRTNSSVFYPERLKEADKYTVFLDGNHSLVTIENLSGAERPGNLLVIRDSFSNSLGCFLADCYDRIVLVDLRYYKLPLTDLIAQQGIDEVLIEYSVKNFMTEPSLAFLSADGEELQRQLGQRQAAQGTESGPEEQEAPAGAVPTNYFAPPQILTDAFFDNTLYLGDSVIGTLATFCAENGKLPGALVSCNALLTYNEVANGWLEHLAYKGNFVTLRTILEDTGATKLIGALGCNDLAQTDVESCKQRTVAFLNAAREISPDITIFMQSVMPILNVQSDFNQPEVEEFNAWLKENAEAYNYCYIELDKPFKGPDGMLSDAYMYTATHINLAGGPVWYEALMQPENYYNFPKELMVEYDAASGMPVGDAPGATLPAESTPSPAPVSIPAEEERGALDVLYEEITRTLEVPAMLELKDDLLSAYLGLSPEDFKDGRFYVCGNNLKADEIWLVELDSEAAAAQMLEKARARIEVKAQSYRNYLPEEYEIASRGIAVTRGRLTALFISPDAEAMLAAFNTAVR